MKNHFPLLLLNFFSDFELRALTCKDKDGDESGSAVAHDIYKAQWAKIQKNIWIAIQRKETLTIRLKLSYYLFEHGAFF